MQCVKCQSTNVTNLSHYFQSLPAESPLRKDYAPPAEVSGAYWQSLLAVVLGIAFLLSGSVLLGLLVTVAGLAWGAVGHAGVERYRGALADWKAARLCLACTGQF